MITKQDRINKAIYRIIRQIVSILVIRILEPNHPAASSLNKHMDDLTSIIYEEQ